MKDNIEILDIDFNDLNPYNIEIIEVEDYEVEIIEVDDTSFVGSTTTIDIPIKESLITKIRKKLTKNTIAKIALCSCTLIVTLTGVFLLNQNTGNEWKKQDNVVYNEYYEDISFSLNEEDYNTVSVNGEYVEKGVTLVVNGEDKSDEVIIDASNINLSRVGTYHVIYTYPININQVKTLYRTINVVDTEPPKITLLGSKVYTMLVGEEYNEAGFLVSDNSHEDLSDGVVIDTNLNSGKPGRYYVKYSVSDSSGNVSEDVRSVVVKSNYYSNTNSVLTNSFNDNGVFFTGIVQDNSFKYQMLLKNKDTGEEFSFDLNKTSNHYYNFQLNIDGLSNGNYEFYLVNDELELLTNNMSSFNRIVRARVNDKLITMDYSKGIVSMNVSDFEYLYDVVIDPGHGGSDSGATNGKYVEKKINLEQSLYEKERYEQMGLRVLLLRDDNGNYGTMMGDTSLQDVERKGFAVGYYGSVSKVVYSNHHNSSTNSSSRGWEILVPAGASYEDLSFQHKIADEWFNAYTGIVNPYYRFYTKDYETATVNNKYNGEIYGFEDYYAVIRIPNKLFNVYNVIFEGAYINNNSDMHWYYDNENWKDMSEIKIKNVVESIGVKYIAP